MPLRDENDELNEIFEKSAEEGVTPRRRSRLHDSPDVAAGGDDNKFDFTACQWSTSNNVIFFPTGKTVTELKPGYYEVNSHPSLGLFFERIPVRTEGLLNFPDANTHKVIQEIKKFWESEEKFYQYDIAYKRGMILWGPPGGGKSCTLQLVCRDVIDRGGIVIKYGNPDLFSMGFRKLRDVQPDTPVVVLMEDIDATIDRYNETDVINTLDGVDRMHKVVFLATTNYPEKLGARIMNRPSRFDKRYKVGYPSPESRKVYLQHLFEKEGELGYDLDKWVTDTENFSIAHLKELFVAVVVFGDEYDVALKTLQQMKVEVTSWGEEERGGIGFTRNGSGVSW